MSEVQRFAITGIDGAGKSTCSKNALVQLSELSEDQPLIRSGRPALRVMNGEVAEEFPHLTDGIDIMHQLADRSRNRRLILSANALNVFAQARVVEPRLIAKYHPTMVMATRDLIVDPAVYSTYYARRTLGNLSVRDRMHFFATVTGSYRDMIILLTVDPHTAVSRIDERIQAEVGNPNLRNKWPHLHENPDDLDSLANEYYRVLEVLRNTHPTPVVEIDTNSKSPDQVTCLISDCIQKYSEGCFAPDDWLTI